jgi:hypothetical protein
MCIMFLKQYFYFLSHVITTILAEVKGLFHKFSFFRVLSAPANFKGAQVWDFDVLDFNDFFIMKSI